MDTQLIHATCSRSIAFSLFGLECQEMDIIRVAKILSMEWHLGGHEGQPSEDEMDVFLECSLDLRNCDRRVAMQAEQLFRLYISIWVEMTGAAMPRSNDQSKLLAVDPFGYGNHSDPDELELEHPSVI